MSQIFAKIIDACFNDIMFFLNENKSNGVFGGIEKSFY
jgi:hypothetical protein